jgi:sec-independent protein translocase protein TatA
VAAKWVPAMTFPLAFLDLNPGTMLFLGVIALLLFGEKLPEVARTWGRKFVDLKKNVENVQNQIRNAAMSAAPDLSSLTNSVSSPSTPRRVAEETPADREEATAPKFVPPPSQG